MDMMGKINSFKDKFTAGSITIGDEFKSYLDYEPYTKITCYLPCIGFVHLDTDLVMNKTIVSSYTVDLFTGSCICNLLVDDNIIYSYTGNCCTLIPFASANYTSIYTSIIAGAAQAAGGILSVVNGNVGGISQMGSGISEAFSGKPDIKHGNYSGGVATMGPLNMFIIMEKPDIAIPENLGTYRGYPSNITLQLGTIYGYTEIEEIHLENISATDEELDEIYNLLKGGVIL